MQRKRERLENERIRGIEIKKIKSAQKVAEIQRMLVFHTSNKTFCDLTNVGRETKERGKKETDLYNQA